ncbi:MAG: hypothetical protein ACOC6Q_01775 [Patescibacteria group bacterium]
MTFWEKNNNSKKEDHKGRKKIIWIALGVVFGGLFFAQFFLCSSLSTQGGEVARLLEKKERLEEENRRIENRIAELTSLENIRRRAEKELGMQIASEYEFLTPPVLAELPQ